MATVNTIKGDLFKLAPQGSILLHACNTKGVWGAGIALEMAKRFPHALKQYREDCQNNGAMLLGKSYVYVSWPYAVGNLYTSKDYGSRKSRPSQILKATDTAIDDLLARYHYREFWLPKINSGLFDVDWRLTKKVLQSKPEDVIFNVCYL